MRNLGILMDPSTLTFERILPGDIHDIWALIVEPEKRTTWLAGGEWELKVGGRAELIFENENLSDADDKPPSSIGTGEQEVAFIGEVLDIDPPRLIEIAWPESAGAWSRVRFELLQQDEQVRLILTQFGVDSIEALRGTAAGWHTHLDILNALQTNSKRPSFWRQFAVWQGVYDQQFARGAGVQES